MNWKQLLTGIADGAAQKLIPPYGVARTGYSAYQGLSQGKAQLSEGRRGDAALSGAQGLGLLILTVVGGIATARSIGKK